MLSEKSVQRWSLQDLVIRTIPGVTKAQASSHFEACLVCLDYNGHRSGVAISIQTEANTNVFLDWSEVIDDRIKRGWNDIQEATEYGASAIAILLILSHTKYTVIERAAKGEGFDYWLLEKENYDDSDPLPKGTARLEVSGMIREEDDRAIRTRVREKLKQTDVSDYMRLPAIVVVVEFSRPEAHMAKKNAEHTQSA